MAVLMDVIHGLAPNVQRRYRHTSRKIEHNPGEAAGACFA